MTAVSRRSALLLLALSFIFGTSVTAVEPFLEWMNGRQPSPP
jgi:hypothetical protein